MGNDLLGYSDWDGTAPHSINKIGYLERLDPSFVLRIGSERPLNDSPLDND